MEKFILSEETQAITVRVEEPAVVERQKTSPLILTGILKSPREPSAQVASRHFFYCFLLRDATAFYFCSFLKPLLPNPGEWVVVSVLGHVLEHVPRHVLGMHVPEHMLENMPVNMPDRPVPEYVLKHVPKHVLRHMLDKHVLNRMAHAVLMT